MYNGDPNRPANPFTPQSYERMPFQPGATNPYGLGYQRVAGQLAPQVSYRPYHQMNTAPGASMTGIYAREQYPNALGLGQRQLPPLTQPAVSNDPYGSNPRYQHQGPPGWSIAPEPRVPFDELFRRLGY